MLPIGIQMTNIDIVLLYILQCYNYGQHGVVRAGETGNNGRKEHLKQASVERCIVAYFVDC